MKLSQILKDTSLRTAADCEITHITNDSRDVFPGTVFFAMKGSRSDGAAFIRQAAEKGAAAVICEAEIPDGAKNEFPGIIFMSSSEILKDLAAAAAEFYGRPSKKLKVYGFTGTKGKTTTAYLLEHILAVAGEHPGVLGTIDYRVDGKILSSSVNTTPFAHTLQRLLSVMADAGAKSAVLEISSHALALYRADRVDFDVAVFTNLQRDHMDFHKTREDYFQAKARIFELLSLSGKPDRCAVINADDEYAARLTGIIHGKNLKLTTYGIKKPADFTADSVEISENGTSFRLKAPGETRAVKIHLPGLYNVYNALAAITAAAAGGIPLQTAIKGAEGLLNVPGRLQRVSAGQNFSVFVDYAHTDASLESVLSNLKLMPHKKIITVFGCGGDRDRTKRGPMGIAACSLSDSVIVTDDNPRSEDPRRIFADIEKGIKPLFGNYRIIEDRKKAITAAVNSASDGDILLIAGKGHETYQLLGNSTIHFSDAETAEEAIRQRLGKERPR